MSNKKRGLIRTEELVQTILENDLMARESDDYLYAEVLRVVNPMMLDKPLRVVLNNFSQFEVPAYESVGRARRKIQSQCPWLMSSDKVRKMRADNEQVYREYASMEVRA